MSALGVTGNGAHTPNNGSTIGNILINYSITFLWCIVALPNSDKPMYKCIMSSGFLGERLEFGLCLGHSAKQQGM